jgi:hypothetical protein
MMVQVQLLTERHLKKKDKKEEIRERSLDKNNN